MKYKYVFFNTPDSVWGRDPDGYYTICLEDLKKLDNVQIVAKPLEHKSKYLQLARRINCSRKLNKLFHWKCKKIWYPHWMKLKFDPKKPLGFIFCAGYEELGYMDYLRRKYPSCRIVKLHRDLMKVFLRGGHQEFESFYKEKNYPFDLLYSYDEGEAAKYNAKNFSEFESKIDIEISKEYPLCDVFFAGRAKDRLPKLMEAYHKFTQAGLTVRYYLTGVSKEERKPYPGIVYADSMMSYREMLYQSVNARCMLEINQAGVVGYTSRFLEAVMYNKKLITDNFTIAKSKFFNPRFMQCVREMADIDTDFVRRDVVVDYQYNNEFSPIHLIEQIDRDLCELDEKQGRNEQ